MAYTPGTGTPAQPAGPFGYQAPQSLDPAQLQGLISHLENSMGMDEQAQQIALNRQMEGYGYGSAINDYLMNDVYGQILGVNFQNPDYSQYLQQTAGTQGQYIPPELPTYYNPNALANLSPQQKAEYIPQISPAEQGKNTIASGGLGGGYFQAGPNGTIQSNGPPSADQIAQMINKYHGGGEDYKGPIDTTHGNPQAMAQAGNYAQGQWEGFAPGTDAARGVATPGKPGQYISGMGPSALGKSMPKGTYTQGGKSFNPNMNSTWAKFLAPTYGKISQLSDQQMQQIQRQMPRGGEQDRAVSDAIAQKYGTMMGGWQSLVPQAMQGLQGIGQSQLYQQPSYTGGTGAMAGMQSGDQNASLQAQQMALQNSQFNKQLEQSKSQNKSGLFGLLGSALGAGASALTGGLGGSLAGLLTGGGKKSSDMDNY